MRLALFVLTAALAAPAAAQCPEGGWDLSIAGGPIYTAVDTMARVDAVAVEAGRIAAVGTETVTACDTARHIDLQGAALFPGFTDAHAHLFGIGLREMTLNLEAVGSIAALKETVKARANELEPGAPLFGRGWIETHWPEDRFPTARDLDEAAPDNPVLLIRADGHAAVVNSLALDRMGVTAETKAPAGGDILRDEAGAPTGMLIDKAMDLAADLQPSETDIDRREAYRTADRVYARYGWTGLHNMSVEPGDVGLIEEMAEAGAIRLRVYNSVDKAGAEALLAEGGSQAAAGRVVTRAVKLYMDGALGSRGAALMEPYADADTSGLMLEARADMLPLLERALRRGIQINTHAIGDKANRLALDWYAAAFDAVPAAERAVTPPRWRIEHAQVLAPADIPRFAEMGVIPSMQPSHAIGDLHFAPRRLGEERLRGAYAWKSFIESGAPIAAGSDAPVERGNPLIEFYAAVGRMDLDGFSGAGWHPEQAVDRATALKMFTLWPAYAAFQEDALGTIETGKQADFTAFSADIMTIPTQDIPKNRAVLTVVGGAVVYSALGD